MRKFSGLEITKRIDFLLSVRKSSRKELADAIGKNKQVFTDWTAKNIVPKADDLYNMADFFNVPMEYLLMGEEIMTDDTAKIAALYSCLSNEDKKTATIILKALVDNRIEYDG